jgi:hypothetical protein
MPWRKYPNRSEYPERIDIYALWWVGWDNSTSQTSIPIARNGMSALRHSNAVVSTRAAKWTGRLPSQIPANYYITIRIVNAGRDPCVRGNCTAFIQDESPEFITFNKNSTVTKLPNNGIRTTVPTPIPPSIPPTNTTLMVSSTVYSTATASSTGMQFYSLR